MSETYSFFKTVSGGERRRANRKSLFVNGLEFMESGVFGVKSELEISSAPTGERAGVRFNNQDSVSTYQIAPD